MARLSTWTVVRTGVGRDGAEHGEIVDALQVIARGKVEAVRLANQLGTPLVTDDGLTVRRMAYVETVRRGTFRGAFYRTSYCGCEVCRKGNSRA